MLLLVARLLERPPPLLSLRARDRFGKPFRERLRPANRVWSRQRLPRTHPRHLRTWHVQRRDPAAVPDASRVRPHHVGELLFAGAGEVGHSAPRVPGRERDEPFRDLSGRHRLRARTRGEMQRTRLRAREHLRGELVELRGSEDRRGDGGRGDQLLLGHLARVVVVGDPVDADDGEQDDVSHAGVRGGGEEVPGGGREELDRRARLQRLDAHDVDHGVGPGQRRLQPAPADQVDAVRTTEHDGLMTRAPDGRHRGRADDAGSSCDDDPHASILTPDPVRRCASRAPAHHDRVRRYGR